MNENYLWDKTGSDHEIEQLEASLQVFRHQKNQAPKLPAKVLPFKPKTAQPRVFPAMLKIAACIAIGVVALAAWMQIFKTSLNNNQTVSQSSPAKNTIVQPESSPSNAPTVAPAFLVTKDETKSDISDKKIYKARYKTAPANFRRAERKREKPVETIEPAIKLTKEEKHAYDQLMLALSITSSNLKAVKNQAEGLE